MAGKHRDELRDYEKAAYGRSRMDRMGSIDAKVLVEDWISFEDSLGGRGELATAKTTAMETKRKDLRRDDDEDASEDEGSDVGVGSRIGGRELAAPSPFSPSSRLHSVPTVASSSSGSSDSDTSSTHSATPAAAPHNGLDPDLDVDNHSEFYSNIRTPRRPRRTPTVLFPPQHFHVYERALLQTLDETMSLPIADRLVELQRIRKFLESLKLLEMKLRKPVGPYLAESGAPVDPAEDEEDEAYWRKRDESLQLINRKWGLINVWERRMWKRHREERQSEREAMGIAQESGKDEKRKEQDNPGTSGGTDARPTSAGGLAPEAAASRKRAHSDEPEGGVTAIGERDAKRHIREAVGVSGRPGTGRGVPVPSVSAPIPAARAGPPPRAHARTTAGHVKGSGGGTAPPPPTSRLPPLKIPAPRPVYTTTQALPPLPVDFFKPTPQRISTYISPSTSSEEFDDGDSYDDEDDDSPISPNGDSHPHSNSVMPQINNNAEQVKMDPYRPAPQFRPQQHHPEVGQYQAYYYESARPPPPISRQIVPAGPEPQIRAGAMMPPPLPQSAHWPPRPRTAPTSNRSRPNLPNFERDNFDESSSYNDPPSQNIQSGQSANDPAMSYLHAAWQNRGANHEINSPPRKNPNQKHQPWTSPPRPGHATTSTDSYHGGAGVAKPTKGKTDRRVLSGDERKFSSLSRKEGKAMLQHIQPAPSRDGGTVRRLLLGALGAGGGDKIATGTGSPGSPGGSPRKRCSPPAAATAATGVEYVWDLICDGEFEKAMQEGGNTLLEEGLWIDLGRWGTGL
ncbi:hypothetical protein DFH27DRAFT_603831 [Peziza echinospora]|nr:hypothetical protein DFH27DRAFT_603831 [Peziza echinospora]